MTKDSNLKETVIETQKQYVMPCIETWADVVFVDGKGATLIDSEGKQYIDCFAGVAVVNAGHCHPKVVKAVKDQVEKITHLSTLYYTVPMGALAKKLSEIVPIERGKIKKSFFCNSGTEANEHAVTLAKKYTKKNEVIGLQCGFYGRGGMTMGLSGLGAWRAGLGPFMPGILHAPSYYCYRCPLGHMEGPPDCGYACAHYVEHMLKTETTQQVAAFVAEPIFGIGGCVHAPKEYFKIISEILKPNGILLIIDEVQTGFGRTGDMFAIEHYGVEPDILSLAKGIASGIPMGAITSRASIADSYTGPHFSTFGGNPLSCAAALASIEAIIEEDMPSNAAKVGAYMLKRLEEMQKEHEMLDDVQGRGLMIGAEIVTDKNSRKPAPNEILNKIQTGAVERGVLFGRGGLYYNRIRIQPPLCLTKDEASKAMDVLDEVLTTVERST